MHCLAVSYSWRRLARKFYVDRLGREISILVPKEYSRDRQICAPVEDWDQGCFFRQGANDALHSLSERVIPTSQTEPMSMNMKPKYGNSYGQCCCSCGGGRPVWYHTLGCPTWFQNVPCSLGISFTAPWCQSESYSFQKLLLHLWLSPVPIHSDRTLVLLSNYFWRF